MVRGATKLLLGIPTIRKLDLIPEIKGAYIRAFESKPVGNEKVETETSTKVTTLPATKRVAGRIHH